MTNAELTLLQTELSLCSHYLEFGAGNSTLLAACCPNIKTITTVESDKGFMENLLQNSLLTDALNQKRITALYVNIGPTLIWGYPADESQKVSWPDYSYKPFEYSTGYDLVLVDGRFRVACILQVCLHLPAGTKILIHDFYNRPKYHIILLFLEETEYADSLGLFFIKNNNDPDRLKKYLSLYQYVSQ